MFSGQQCCCYWQLDKWMLGSIKSELYKGTHTQRAGCSPLCVEENDNFYSFFGLIRWVWIIHTKAVTKAAPACGTTARSCWDGMISNWTSTAAPPLKLYNTCLCCSITAQFKETRHSCFGSRSVKLLCWCAWNTWWGSCWGILNISPSSQTQRKPCIVHLLLFNGQFYRRWDLHTCRLGRQKQVQCWLWWWSNPVIVINPSIVLHTWIWLSRQVLAEPCPAWWYPCRFISKQRWR